ncbi:MAG: sigma-70 family RNA polymerase sigma factor [Capsulimonadales bacterium]|nr:sigma-70 family RNA polymerase sigma factor [Capsulimonadales bacterium]
MRFTVRTPMPNATSAVLGSTILAGDNVTMTVLGKGGTKPVAATAPGSVVSALPTRTMRAPDPDALLVRQHLAGDPKAFEALFRKYQTPIFNLVTRMVRGEDAYDLTQDVFLKAYKHLRSFRGDAKFSTWLFTIARHTCLNHLRHKNVIGEDSLDESQEEHPGNEPIDVDMNVNRMCETRELQRVVDDLLQTMPAEARMLLILRDFEQLSYEEISQVTELSIVNVKSKIHRARQAFKKRFQPYLELLEGGVGR